jgi:hypothetical protein
LNVKANGEIISTIISLRDETVFAVSTNVRRSSFDSTPVVSGEFTLGSRQSPSQLEKRGDRCSGAAMFTSPPHQPDRTDTFAERKRKGRHPMPALSFAL